MTVGHDRVQPRRRLVVQQDVGLGGDRPASPTRFFMRRTAPRASARCDVPPTPPGRASPPPPPGCGPPGASSAAAGERDVVPHVHRVRTSADPWKSIPNFRRAPTSSRSSILEDVPGRRSGSPRFRAEQSHRALDEDRLARAGFRAMTTVFFPFGTVRSSPFEDHFLPKRWLNPRIAITPVAALSRQNMNRRHEVVRDEHHHGGPTTARVVARRPRRPPPHETVWTR